MAFRRKCRDRVMTVDLDGPQGNVYYLMSLADTLEKANFAGTAEYISDVPEHCKALGGYTAIVYWMDQRYGKVLVFETDKEELLTQIDEYAHLYNLLPQRN